jgi:hypothetical protein
LKKELPAGPLTWNGNRFKKDQTVISGSFIRARTQERTELQCDHPGIAASFLTVISGEHHIVNTWAKAGC